jgi:hypothetical protein
MLDYLLGDLLPSFKTALQSRTAYKNLMKDGPLGATGGEVPVLPKATVAPAIIAPGIVPRLRQMIGRIQAAPNYTESIGRDFDIIGVSADTHTGTSSAKPTAKAVSLGHGEVRIEWVKGKLDGVVIEGRRTGESDWSKLGTDNYSPYLDGRPPLHAGQTELREYRLKYLMRDEEVGDWSDTISVSAAP